VDRKRRGVLRLMFGSASGLGFAALGAVGGLWTAAIGRFLFPNAVTAPPSTFRVGAPSDYPPGRVETKYREACGVWVVHGVYHGQRQIFALRTACTHLGCILTWQETEQKFQCSCHGSGFSRDGINVEGPAPRPLERCAIRIAGDGRLEIDTSRAFREERGEWSDPESYVRIS
jgi:cytochrome b6-f complex iron-sulfur subunit